MLARTAVAVLLDTLVASVTSVLHARMEELVMMVMLVVVLVFARVSFLVNFAKSIVVLLLPLNVLNVVCLVVFALAVNAPVESLMVGMVIVVRTGEIPVIVLHFQDAARALIFNFQRANNASTARTAVNNAACLHPREGGSTLHF